MSSTKITQEIRRPKTGRPATRRPETLSRPASVRPTRSHQHGGVHRSHISGRRLHRAEPPAVSSVASCRWQEQQISLELVPYHPGHSACKTYNRLQIHVYGQYNVWGAKRISDRYMQSCTHLVLARNLGGVMLGGVRIHARRLGMLPIEGALPDSSRLRDLLAELGECVELSGTIVHRSARKTGLSELIVRTAVAALPLVQAQKALGFGHQRVLPLYQRFGFMPDPRFGIYRYPDARYQSRVAVMHDVSTLSGVTGPEREHIMDMRARLRDGMLANLAEELAS